MTGRLKTMGCGCCDDDPPFTTCNELRDYLAATDAEIVLLAGTFVTTMAAINCPVVGRIHISGVQASVCYTCPDGDTIDILVRYFESGSFFTCNFITSMDVTDFLAGADIYVPVDPDWAVICGAFGAAGAILRVPA